MLQLFRLIAFLEGISYILLLFIASPIKAFTGDAQYVKMLGMPHGILFIAYVVLAIVISKRMQWSNGTLAKVLLASILPFGTFYVEYKYLKQNPS
ncbi:DUF3817 domain-containing protein [Bizionia argentinensis JUB59]|uniref:DUF3817 domain-containing protein n=1 Tax=Bizionia argentinensis JUB59 TaxID=1046627 RepID=G2E9M5_9FLAO|nr:DUF3817 domain-containing protein [Bizionia argentinensis]EGV45003.1 DUF3817 domain-containing protein [Bizionia argentinensis JUB59]